VVYDRLTMPRRGNQPIQGEILQGTLDLLILKTLALGPAHGHTIAHAIERRSDEVLQVEHGSLYPALHRLEDRGWIASFWGTSENNRRARYYRLTPAGRRQLTEQTTRWDRLVRAINGVLRPATE
jgi:PadR family transcriptional regulator